MWPIFFFFFFFNFAYSEFVSFFEFSLVASLILGMSYPHGSPHMLCVMPFLNVLPFPILKLIHWMGYGVEFDCINSLYAPSHDKTNKMVCAPSEDSDQPGPAAIARSEACPLGMQAAPSSIPTSGTFFRGYLVMKKILHSPSSADPRRAVVSYWRKNVR